MLVCVYKHFVVLIGLAIFVRQFEQVGVTVMQVTGWRQFCRFLCLEIFFAFEGRLGNLQCFCFYKFVV